MGTKLFSDIITFTRASSATRVNSSGLVETVASNQPRFDYDPVTLQPKGLLVEEQRTNLIISSQDIGSWGLYGGSHTASQDSTSPMGDTSAWTLNDTDTSAYSGRVRSVSTSTSTTYTFSCYVKQGTSSAGFSIWLVGNGSSTFFQGTIAWSSGVPVATGWKSSYAGGGWYRVSYAFNSGVCTSLAIYLLPAITSVVATGSTVFWGAQLEVGTFSTSYIPTTTAASTRAADVAKITGANFSSWYNQTEGTLFVEWDAPTEANPASSIGAFSVSDGTTNERIQIRRYAGASTISFLAIDDGVVQYNDYGTLPFNGASKSALAYKTNDFIGASGGSLGAADTSGTIPTTTQAEIGFGNGITYTNGHIRRVAYYPRRLTNEELQALTA